MDIIKGITEIGSSILHAPAWVLLVLALNLLGIFLQATPILPNRFNFLIGYLLLVLGMILTPLIVPKTFFPPEQPNPIILLVIVGMIFGIVAWLLHGLIVQRVVAKYFPQNTENKTDTQPCNQ
ncbi:MAG: hypothetical protein WCH99_08865 [Verrucomicrobiota bacterium]